MYCRRPCPEDELGKVLLTTLVFDFVASKAIALATALFKNALAYAKHDKTTHFSVARDDFSTAPMIISLLYNTVSDLPCNVRRKGG